MDPGEVDSAREGIMFQIPGELMVGLRQSHADRRQVAGQVVLLAIRQAVGFRETPVAQSITPLAARRFELHW